MAVDTENKFDFYLKLLNDGYKFFSEEIPACGRLDSKLEYLAEHVFDLITYQTDMSKVFAKKMLDVCKVISNNKAVANPEGYIEHVWFLLMCNAPFVRDRIDWGSSIRSAFWTHDGIKLKSCGFFLDDEQYLDELEFSSEEWKIFIEAVTAFSDTEGGRG